MKLTQEEWRAVVGFEGYYEVSSIGRVRSVSRKARNANAEWVKTGKVKTLTISYGRSVVALWKENVGVTWHVHRLVAYAFLGPSNGLSVNHIDGDKANDHVENLEYLSLRDNSLHQYANGLTVIPIGSRNGKSKLKESDIPLIRALAKETRMTKREIAARFGVAQETIFAVLQGRTWSHIK